MKIVFSIITTVFLISACSNLTHTSSDEIEQNVTAWADAYFNYHFDQASTLVTAESRQWLQYAASNVHEADVELLRQAEQGASITVNDIYQDNDTSAQATITVENYLRMDTIGNAGQMIPQATFIIPLVLRNNRWMIRMVNLPRSEK